MVSTAYEAIRLVLDQACRLFEQLGIMIGQNADCFRVYKYRMSLLAEERFELIILPTEPGLPWEKFLRAGAGVGVGDLLAEDVHRAEKDRPDASVVDCFGESGQGGVIERSNVQVLSPLRLWSRLSGIERYQRDLANSCEQSDVESQYIKRWFARVVRDPIERVQQEGGAIDAIEWLLEWGKDIRSGGQNILIYGERGSGKTWILRRFAALQLERHLRSPWTTPPAFYLPLREYAGILRSMQGLRKTLSYFFHDQYPSMGPSHLYFWEAVIQSGAAILLLDGFDELAREVSVDGMVRHLERLSFLLPGNARVVLTTRGTVFPSPAKMVEVFSGVASASDSSIMTGEEFLRQEDVAVSVRARSIYSIIPFSPVDLEELARKKGLIRKDRLDGDAVVPGTHARETPGAEGLFADLLSEHSRLVTGDKSILAACLKLGEIPACANFMMSFLLQLERDDEQLQRDDKPVSLIRLFEMSLIGPLVSYNVALDRALVFFNTRRREPARDPKAAITISNELNELDVAKKLSVLEFIAWNLIVSRQNQFNSDHIAAAALDSPEADFKEVVNDLRSQTVFDFSDDGVGLAFRLREIHAYFVARGISSLLWDPLRWREGIARFGRYDWTLTSGVEQQQQVGAFLWMFALHGMLKFTAQQETPDEDATIDWKADLLMQRCIEFIKDEPTYSMRTRYIRRNLEMLSVPAPEEVTRLDWEIRPLVADAERDEAFQAALEPGQDVLVSGDPGRGIDPFLIALHEVRNQDYGEFLASEWVPYVERGPNRVDSQPEVLFRRRGLSATNVNDHPLSWRMFHLGPKPRDFEGFTNDYHLMAMGHGFPDEQAGHPVVWISAYVAVIYLNWKTIVSGVFSEDGKDCFYRILLDKTGRPLIKRQEGKLGYRLPTVEEWRFAARANDQKDFPWKRLQDSGDEAKRAKAKRLENFLTLQSLLTTRDVWTSIENDFGVYGMIGNVREWADPGTGFDEEAKASHRCQIMGSSPALGPETFRYDFPGIKLYPGNTNPDVGFRWARSVPGEIKQIIDEMRQVRAS